MTTQGTGSRRARRDRTAGPRVQMTRRGTAGLMALGLAVILGSQLFGESLAHEFGFGTAGLTVSADLERCARERLTLGAQDDRGTALRFCIAAAERREALSRDRRSGN